MYIPLVVVIVLLHFPFHSWLSVGRHSSALYSDVSQIYLHFSAGKKYFISSEYKSVAFCFWILCFGFWSRTGFYYDEIFTKHKNEWDETYPECPERVAEPFARCCELGLVDRCERVQVRKVFLQMIMREHQGHQLARTNHICINGN